MLYSHIYRESRFVQGGVSQLSSEGSEITIDVWGHQASQEETVELGNRLHKFLNDDFTTWDYFKMGFQKLWDNYYKLETKYLGL